MPNNNPKPQVLWVIHAAFLMSVPMYAAVAHFVILQMPGRMPYDPILSNVLIFLGVIQIPLGVLVPNWMAKLNALVAFIISDAIFESIAIYGVLGGFLGMPAISCYAMMAVSFALLAGNTLRLRM